MGTHSFREELAGYSLTTAEIIYRLPDHPSLLQSYVWQDYDLAPRFPKLHQFLDYWSIHLDGALFHIRIANARLLSPRDLRVTAGLFSFN